MLNFHHLRYFWLVARAGSVVQAARSLGVSQPTISTQLKQLETDLGERLLARRGRTLVPTEMGQLVLRYAEDIFALGSELEDTVRGRPTGGPQRFTVGVSDALPKLTTLELLRPALAAPHEVGLVVRVDKTARLVADLSTYALDLVLADEPVPGTLKVRAFNHVLGESDVTVFAVAALAARHRRGFPRSLDGAPFLLPSDHTALRRSLEQFFAAARVRPRVVAQVDDLGMLQVLGQQGLGLFAAPTVVADVIIKQHAVEAVGRLPLVKERFYAITVERRLRHPAAIAISEAAREQLLA